jgi:hypothetical protein
MGCRLFQTRLARPTGREVSVRCVRALALAPQGRTARPALQLSTILQSSAHTYSQQLGPTLRGAVVLSLEVPGITEDEKLCLLRICCNVDKNVYK